ncbi:MAG: hypothetical protein Q8R25_05070 [bacterium]|nr:hypothetical protein [bacterium]
MAESPIQSSFIPRDAATPVQSVVRRSGLYDLVMLVSVVLFVASVVLAIGVFLYVQFLNTESASKLAHLQRAKAAFEPALIQKLTRLDDRMRVADEVLASHIAPIMVLQILEQSTLQTVAFQSFDFKAPDSQNITITMSGVAQSVNSVALQADLFSKSTLITSPIFSGISRAGNGVHFSVKSLINPALIRYASLVNGTGASVNPLQGVMSAPVGTSSSVSPFTGVPATQ